MNFKIKDKVGYNNAINLVQLIYKGGGLSGKNKKMRVLHFGVLNWILPFKEIFVWTDERPHENVFQWLS